MEDGNSRQTDTLPDPPATEPLAIWRAALAIRLKQLCDRLDDLDRAVAAITAITALAQDRQVLEIWAARTVLPPSPRQPGRKVGRPLGSRDRFPRLPRGTLRANGHAQEG